MYPSALPVPVVAPTRPVPVIHPPCVATSVPAALYTAPVIGEMNGYPAPAAAVRSVASVFVSDAPGLPDGDQQPSTNTSHAGSPARIAAYSEAAATPIDPWLPPESLYPAQTISRVGALAITSVATRLASVAYEPAVM